MKELELNVSLFGKHPSSSEYLYLGQNSNFTNSIINWIKSGYEAVLKNRSGYILDKIYNFYFFKKESDIFVCGTLKISKDSTGREYPLVILVEFSHSLPLNFFQVIWKKNLDIIKKQQSLDELQKSLFKFSIDDLDSFRDNSFQDIDTKVLCAFVGEDFSEMKFFYKPLQVDDFITIMR